MNIPNLLTILRILLTPLFIICLMRDLPWLALVVFTVAGISDGLDGLIARYFNQRTTLGAYLDPIADKFLLMSAFISLAVFEMIPGWLTVIVICRDVVIVLGIAILTITNKKYEIAPTLISKTTTVSQITTVILVLLTPWLAILSKVMGLLVWITAVLTTISGLNYIYRGLNILQDTSNNNTKNS